MGFYLLEQQRGEEPFYFTSEIREETCFFSYLPHHIFVKKEGRASVVSLTTDIVPQSLQLRPSSHTGYGVILQKKA